MLAGIRSKWLIPGCVSLLLLTLVAGALQYQWIKRVSDADRRQRHDYLIGTLRNFSGDFRETILRPLPFFRAPQATQDSATFEQSLLELSQRWRNVADRPQLLKSLGIGRQGKSGDRKIVFKRTRLGEEKFVEEPWPQQYSLYREILEKHLRLPGGDLPFFPRGFVFDFSQSKPVLILPLIAGLPMPQDQAPADSQRQLPRSLTSEEISEGRPPFQQPPGPRELLQALRPPTAEGTIKAPELEGWCFLEIDADYLREHLIPEMVERHYGSVARSEYQVAVVNSQPPGIIYGSEPGLTIASLSAVDGGVVLLEANMSPGRPGPPPPGPPPGPGRPPDRRRQGMPPPPPPGPQPFVGDLQGVPLLGIAPNRGVTPEDNLWLLVVKNKSGSLESLVEHSRLHNLAVSFGILLLLAGSIVMLMLAAARARSLARQQMEFVAGVSHELRTPLTVIHSTSYNLSRGMIHDPGRVQQYGEVIQQEARRLINQVEQMLSFAGIQSGRRVYDPQPIDVVEVIDRILAEYAAAFAEKNWEVEKQVAGNLPLVLSDVSALESALKNLFENALKYAGEGQWLKVSASADQVSNVREVRITVADRGPGIAPNDLPHIFEPFYRGHDVIASPITGAGLGLSLVERQMRALGGRVTVQSSGDGTAFTLHLPAVAG